MSEPLTPIEILSNVLRADGLYTQSERKRALALLLKVQRVPNKNICDLLQISAQSVQGWWRDWQADPGYATLVDRRRAYAIDPKQREQVFAYLDKDPPGHMDSWSIRALAKVLKIKQQLVETILKSECRIIPERASGDERIRSGEYDRNGDGKRVVQVPTVDPERQKVFDDTLKFIEDLESGTAPNQERQAVFDDVLGFIEEREAARDRGETPPERDPSPVLEKQLKDEEKSRSKSKQARQKVFEDALKFIDQQERNRST